MAKVAGVQQTAAELHALAAAVGDLDAPLLEAAGRAADTLRPLVPVRTGALRASVRAELVTGSPTLAVGGPTAPYAGAVNARVGFIARAVAQLEPQAVAALSDGIDHEIRKRGLD